MPERSEDWMKQAERDLKTAEKLLKEQIYEWACFIAHQAAEKAVKAVIQKLGGIGWGHSINNLLKLLSEKIEVKKELLNLAKTLDKYYVPTRYPNSFETGSPYEYFTREEAEKAILHSREIIRFCKNILAKTRRTNKPNKKESN